MSRRPDYLGQESFGAFYKGTSGIHELEYIVSIAWPRTLVRSSVMGDTLFLAHVLWVEARTAPRTVPSPTVAVTAAE